MSYLWKELDLESGKKPDFIYYDVDTGRVVARIVYKNGTWRAGGLEFASVEHARKYIEGVIATRDL